MRKAGLFVAAVTLMGSSARADGPAEQQCRSLPARLGDAGDAAAGHQTRDCFEGEIFVLDGRPFQTPLSSQFACASDADCAENVAKGIPLNLVCDIAIGTCAKKMLHCPEAERDSEAPSGCKRWTHQDLGGAVITRLLELLDPAGRGRNRATDRYDQIVLWDADFETKSGMIFQRFQDKNFVDGLGNINRSTAPPLADIPALGWVLAGSTARVDDDLEDVLPCPPDVGCRFTPGLYNVLDALAQSVGHVFTGYAKIDLSGLPREVAGNFTSQGLQAESTRLPRNWSAFADLPASLTGGNEWRESGDGTFETELPARLTFQPLDLYFMGLVPSAEVPPFVLFARPHNEDVISPPPPVPTWFGPGMGIVPGVKIRPREAGMLEVSMDRIIRGSGKRDPSFEAAPHQFRQLWVLVTLPGTTPAAEVTKSNGRLVPGALAKLQKWRRTFNWYFYLSTHGRGRMITTFEGNVDDSPYWEFAQPIDDVRAFEPAGGLVVRGMEQGVVTVDAQASSSTMTFRGYPLPIRIDADAFDEIALRMRVSKGAFAGRNVRASVSFPGGPQAVGIPGGVESLVDDGEWHTYRARLDRDPAWRAGARYGSFVLSPSGMAVEGLEIDSVRIDRHADSEDPPETNDGGANDAAQSRPDGGSPAVDGLAPRRGCGCRLGGIAEDGAAWTLLILAVVAGQRTRRLSESATTR